MKETEKKNRCEERGTGGERESDRRRKMVSLHEGDREKKIAAKKEGQKERESLTDGEKWFLCMKETEKKIRSKERRKEGSRFKIVKERF